MDNIIPIIQWILVYQSYNGHWYTNNTMENGIYNNTTMDNSI